MKTCFLLAAKGNQSGLLSQKESSWILFKVLRCTFSGTFCILSYIDLVVSKASKMEIRAFPSPRLGGFLRRKGPWADLEGEDAACLGDHRRPLGALGSFR